jgi:NAD(P)-dependent dehydrogenase (short-subunit alcohol dehydrogenase family)
MTERVVLITGCSTGIGRCLARGLKARGYRVLATVRQQKDVAGLEAEGFDSFVIDLDSSESIASGAAEALRRSGGQLFALINNGGYGQPGAVEDLPRDAMRAQFETIVFGWQELTNRLMPVFRAQGHGRIVQISSILGYSAIPYRGAYIAAKHAVEGLADTMRLELHGTGIEVVLVEPGPITSQFRVNAHRAFERFIDSEHSVHRNYYQRVRARLGGTKPLPFTLPPEAVLKKVIHALESRRPQARYPVTFPSHLFAWLKRLLSTRMFDHFLRAASGGGKR